MQPDLKAGCSCPRPMTQRRAAHPGERPFARLSRVSSMPRRHRFALALAASTAMVAAGPAFAKAKAGEAAPISDLVKAVDIPYQAFTLDNGLRVIVHEDHKAPVVAEIGRAHV